MIAQKTLVTGAGTFVGTDGNDVLIGGLRADLFVGSKGFDTLDGGGSYDTVSYENTPFIEVVEINPPSFPYTIEPTAGSGVVVDLAAGTAAKTVTTYVVDSDSIRTEIGLYTDRLISIENVVGGLVDDVLLGSSASNVLSGMDGNDLLNGREGKDSLLGGEGQDSLIGGSEADVLFGGNGNDIATGGTGADRIDGGANGPEIVGPAPLPPGIPAVNFGFVTGDLVSYGDSAAAVTIDLNLKGPQSGGDAQGDELINIESVSGSAFHDTITVNGGYAFGNGGKDQLYGGSVSDALIGGDSNDRLFGGGGDDLLAGDSRAPFAPSGSETNEDELYGGNGNDFLIGGVGADLLNGGSGDDVYYMVDSEDVIRDAGGIDTVITNMESYALDKQLENLVFDDNGAPINHVGTGSAGNNLMIGGSANDTLFAGAGSDTLNGGDGDDVLADLVGHDTIVFSDGTDTAIGFGAAGKTEQDIIDLSNRGFASLDDFYAQGGTIVQVGKDTQIHLYDDGPTLILQGVSVDSIDDSDFYFG